MSVVEAKEFVALLEDILDECADDHVGLWSVVREVHAAMPDAPASEIQDVALELLRFLLHRHLIEAGFPAANGRSFDAWTTPPDGTIQRIADQWAKLGRDPTGGEIVWFTTPGGT